MSGNPFLLSIASVAFVFLFLQPHLTSSCDISTFYCGTNSNNSAKSCGRSKLRCENSSVLIQFYGQGQWYSAASIEYPDRVIRIWDTNTNLLSRLENRDCDFIYNFTTPIQKFHPSQIESLDPNFTFFNCTPDTYDFSRDVVGKSTGSPFCKDYDLLYTYRPKKPPPGGTCFRKGSDAVEMELTFEDDGAGAVSFFLRSIGYSSQRALDPQCFSCNITGGLCSAIKEEEHDSSCSCRHDHKCPRKARLNLLRVLYILAAFVFFLSSGASIFFCMKKSCVWNITTAEEASTLGQSVESFLEIHGAMALRRYKYSELKTITNSFIEKLGKGGYGTVYKGMLPNGDPVAVKILGDAKGRSGEEFINEVASIGRTNHVNIVSLLGFCYQGDKRRALVYEFMDNGSLEKFLFHENLSIEAPLGWDRLFSITVGIARGLEYLHRGCKTRIVHFDIKPHNILLDKDFCPKISDFGLAKLCLTKESVLSMVCARGTVGYIAPEVFSRNFGPVSSKSDIYSYGMMVLEMVGRRRNADSRAAKSSEVYFPHWVYDHFDKDEDLAAYGITEETQEIAKKMTVVGLCCIQTNPASRPTISRVLEMLEGSLADLQLPPKPYICSPPRSELDIPDSPSSSTVFVASDINY